tara:strand:- start:64 stop:1140 length:1077 start_codon:yes stop_codon:yes gene_type:complete
MQRNFILTDIMKTGDHRSYEQFIDTHSLADQEFDCTGEYYTLHQYELDNYHRKFALIDMRIHNNRLIGNDAYRNDLYTRLELLHQQGFVFILTNPWESADNIKSQIFVTGEKMKKIEIPYPYYTWTGGVSWFWSFMYHKHKDNKPQVTHKWPKIHEFLYLNKATREHRVKLYNKLLKQNILDNSIYTFVNMEPPRRLQEKYEIPGIDPKNYPRWGMDQDIYGLPYSDSVCSLVSETNDNDYEIFMTEKIWKPIMAQHTFVIHGNHLYLQKLREMGFKTFSSHFDESYDLERDPDKRIDKIVSLCKELQKKNWQDVYLQTKALRQHNYDTFFNSEKLSMEVNKTLQLFLEFADAGQVPS